MKSRILIAFITFIAFTLAGCSGGHPTTVPKYASLTNANVIIEAIDGSWELKSGETFTPPFIKDIESYPTPRVRVVQKNISLYGAGNYPDYVQDVTVTVGKEKFHGKMLFTKVYEKAGSASAKRRWTVGIPESYLKIARSGNVAVLYQPYTYNRQDWASWVLWISNLPL